LMAEVNGFKLLSINLLVARLAICGRLFSSDSVCTMKRA